MIEFKLPDIGEGLVEGEIVKWLVTEGQTVAEHQSVAELMTDKAITEIPAPAAGIIVRLLVEEGETVPVGEVIFHLSADADIHGQSAESVAKPVIAEPVIAAPAPVPAQVGSSSKTLAVPSARRVARDLGIDLSLVTGTGSNGVIRRTDVESFVQHAAPTAALEQRIPFRGVRRKISEAMVRSKQTAMHFTVVEEVDVTSLVTLRAKAKALGAERGIKVTYMPFIMKAVAKGLAEYPMLNGHLDEEAEQIVLPGHVDLGIATDTPGGLLVPVVRGVESKGLLELASDLADLAERARSGKIKSDELRGSTFSITNAGNIGGTLATPIINWPDIAILGVHRIVKRPGVVEAADGDRIEVRHYMNLSCSVDHRLADGADAARFLAFLRRILEEPGLLAL